MKLATKLFEQYEVKQSGANSQRAEIISRIVDGINKERIATKSKYPLIKSGSGAMKKLCILINQHPQLKDNGDLERFYGLCKEAKSFGGYCYGTLNPKNI